MAIFLVQHGRCFDKEADPDRSLTPNGQAEIIRIADQASENCITVSTIYHSGKLRAQQTAELFAKSLGASQVEAIANINPLDNVAEFINLHQLSDSSMIVGHLPFMERLTSYLLTGQQEPAIVKFQNAGIVCLERNENDQWYVKWTIMPVID